MKTALKLCLEPKSDPDPLITLSFTFSFSPNNLFFYHFAGAIKDGIRIFDGKVNFTAGFIAREV